MRGYLPILSMIVLVVLFVFVSFVASTFLAPKRPTSAKEAPYECGIVPEYEPAERFPVKFYLVAMAFIVLDVEIIFLYPFTTIFRGLAAYGLIVMGVFLLILLVPFAYLLSTGALDWGPVKQVTARVGATVLRAVGAPGRDGLDPAAVGAEAAGEPTSPERPRRWVSSRSATTSSPAGSRTSSTGPARARCGRRRSGSRAARSR